MEGLEEELSRQAAVLGGDLIHALDDLASRPQVSLSSNALSVRGPSQQEHQAQCYLLCCNKPMNVKCNTKSGEQAIPNLLVATRKLAAKVDSDHGDLGR